MQPLRNSVGAEQIAAGDTPVEFEPPEMSTLPSCRSTAAAPERTSPMGFQDCQVPAGTLGTDAVRKNTHSSTSVDVVKNLLMRRK